MLVPGYSNHTGFSLADNMVLHNDLSDCGKTNPNQVSVQTSAAARTAHTQRRDQELLVHIHGGKKLFPGTRREETRHGSFVAQYTALQRCHYTRCTTTFVARWCGSLLYIHG